MVSFVILCGFAGFCLMLLGVFAVFGLVFLFFAMVWFGFAVMLCDVVVFLLGAADSFAVFGLVFLLFGSVWVWFCCDFV